MTFGAEGSAFKGKDARPRSRAARAGRGASSRTSQNSVKAKFAEFSGSCIVASRNSLMHNGATPATKSERFDAEGVPPCCSRVLSAASERLLATVNFREYLFHALW